MVCGGSIGGLMAAHALIKAGCKVTVLERAKSVSSAGAGYVQTDPGVGHAMRTSDPALHVRMTFLLSRRLGLDPRTEEAMEALGLRQQLHQHSLPMPIELNRCCPGSAAV